MSAMFPQFTEHLLPCEGCGVEVRGILATDELASDWADDKLAVWCPDCWAQRGGEVPQP